MADEKAKTTAKKATAEKKAAPAKKAETAAAPAKKAETTAAPAAETTKTAAKTTSKTTKAPAAAKKATAPKTTASTKPSATERAHMIEVAAYFIAESNGFQGCPSSHWAAAEIQIARQLGE